MRIGWVSGPRPLLERLELHQQASSLHASGLSQAFVALLLEHWGPEGLSRHLAHVRRYYANQARVFLEAASRHLTGLADWTPPSAGMFCWLKLRDVDDTRRLIEEEARKAKVLLVPGHSFSPGPRAPPEIAAYVRAAFSTASAQEMDEALRRLASILKQRNK